MENISETNEKNLSSVGTNSKIDAYAIIVATISTVSNELDRKIVFLKQIQQLLDQLESERRQLGTIIRTCVLRRVQ